MATANHVSQRRDITTLSTRRPYPLYLVDMKSLPISSVPPSGMPDTLGRAATDLKLSITDRCTLRCSYCIPAEGLPWLAKPEMLIDEVLLRIIRVFVGLGAAQVRLTGGEPLLGRSRVDLWRALRRCSLVR